MHQKTMTRVLFVASIALIGVAVPLSLFTATYGQWAFGVGASIGLIVMRLENNEKKINQRFTPNAKIVKDSPYPPQSGR